jgi:hypothetical protein
MNGFGFAQWARSVRPELNSVTLPRLGSVVGFSHARTLSVANGEAREGFPTAAQRLLSFLRLVAELGAKEGVFLQSTGAMAR